MDARKMVLATSFFSALIVLGTALPLAYLGFQRLDQKIEAGQTELNRVVIDLKTEALAEIKSVSETAASVAAAGAGAVPSNLTVVLSSLTNSMAVLQKDVGELRKEQQELAGLMNLRTEGLTTASMAIPMPMRPGAREDTLNQTIHFALGKFDGAETTRQVEALVPEIMAYSASGACKSNVMGFSDTLGGDKSNLELSLKRAEHVATLLRGKQIPIGEVQGWGERWLYIHTVDGVNNDMNRRVVVETACAEASPEGTENLS